MAKTANLALRIEPALKSGLEKAASADRRTVSNYVEALIAEDLRTKGIISEGDTATGVGVVLKVALKAPLYLNTASRKS